MPVEDVTIAVDGKEVRSVMVDEMKKRLKSEYLDVTFKVEIA